MATQTIFCTWVLSQNYLITIIQTSALFTRWWLTKRTSFDWFYKYLECKMLTLSISKSLNARSVFLLFRRELLYIVYNVTGPHQNFYCSFEWSFSSLEQIGFYFFGKQNSCWSRSFEHGQTHTVCLAFREIIKWINDEHNKMNSIKVKSSSIMYLMH